MPVETRFCGRATTLESFCETPVPVSEAVFTLTCAVSVIVFQLSHCGHFPIHLADS